MRLDSSILAPPKWAKIQEKARQHARAAIKVSDFVADTIVRVENAPENPQARRNTTLLGKYRLRRKMAQNWLGVCADRKHLRMPQWL